MPNLYRVEKNNFPEEKTQENRLWNSRRIRKR